MTAKHWLAAIFLILYFSGSSVVSAQFGGQNIPNLSGVADAIAKAANASAAQKSASGKTFNSGLSVPSVDRGAAARGIGRQLRLTIEKEAGSQPALSQLEAGMPELLTNIENEIEKNGLAKRDFGVAVAVAFFNSYETATKRVVPDQPSLIAAKTIAATIKLRWGTDYARLAPAEQERLYESLLLPQSGRIAGTKSRATFKNSELNLPNIKQNDLRRRYVRKRV